jgi:hypothetical protein
MSTNATFKVFTDKMGGTNASSYIGNTGEIFYDPTTNLLRISDGSTAGGTSISNGGSAPVFGCFHKVSDVVATEANAAFSFDWFNNTTAHVNTQGVTVTTGQPTQVVISSAGNYLITVEMLVRTTGNAPRDVFLWLSKNGTDVVESAVKIEVRQGSVETPVYEYISKQWLVDGIAANDYLELKFAVSRIDLMKLEYTAAQTTPYVRPALPSAILTITKI